MRGYYIKNYKNKGEDNMKIEGLEEDELKLAIQEKVIEEQNKLPRGQSLDPEKVKDYTEKIYQLVMFIIKLWIGLK